MARMKSKSELSHRWSATDLTPSYELWVARGECWLVAVDGAERHQGDWT